MCDIGFCDNSNCLQGPVLSRHSAGKRGSGNWTASAGRQNVKYFKTFLREPRIADQLNNLDKEEKSQQKESAADWTANNLLRREKMIRKWTNMKSEIQLRLLLQMQWKQNVFWHIDKILLFINLTGELIASLLLLTVNMII